MWDPPESLDHSDPPPFFSLDPSLKKSIDVLKVSILVSQKGIVILKVSIPVSISKIKSRSSLKNTLKQDIYSL